MNAAWLKVWGEFLQEADSRFRALADEVRAATTPGPAGPAGGRGEQGPAGPAGTEGGRGDKGDTGPTGERGAAGERGTEGAPGARGEPGGRGPSGEQGERGEKGADGRDGIQGPLGPQGPAGRDGIASLDELRGEVAKAVDARLEATVQKRVVEAVASLPVLQYRGVYTEGRAYLPGDCATWAGSLWHAAEPTTDKPGEGKTAWVLMAKKGRDGRDGRDAPAPLPVVTVGAR